MVYRIMVFAGRKDGITHEEFRERYERHIPLVYELTGDAAPLKHTRWYPEHSGPEQKPTIIAGAEPAYHDVVAELTFKDEEAFQAFFQAQATGAVKEAIHADEAGFWDREKMSVVVIGSCESFPQ